MHYLQEFAWFMRTYNIEVMEFGLLMGCVAVLVWAIGDNFHRPLYCNCDRCRGA